MEDNKKCCEGKTCPRFGFFCGPIILFFVLLFVFAKWGPPISFSTTTQTKGDPFVVQGTGKSFVAPDIAKVDLGIQETGTNLKSVQDSVNKKSQSLTDQVKKLGIDAKDIRTISYSVYPQYDYAAPTQTITGYQVATSYEVTIRDFTKINDLLASVTSFGANTVGSINFDLSDNLKNQKLDEARVQAVNEAKTKASGLAGAAGITLGKLINVSETTPVNNRFYAASLSAVGSADKTVTPPSVQAGTTELDVTVSLSYEVR